MRILPFFFNNNLCWKQFAEYDVYNPQFTVDFTYAPNHVNTASGFMYTNQLQNFVKTFPKKLKKLKFIY